jgi:uncharacterized membrane protein YheB (UPF0754 family)
VTRLVVDFVFLPLIGAVHGYLTNVVAVRLLFRPRRPLRVGPWTLQGVVPRRRAELTAAVAEGVARELLSLEDLAAGLFTEGLEQRLRTRLERHLAERLDARLPRFLPPPLRSVLLRATIDLVGREAAAALPPLLAEAGEGMRRLPVADLVRRRLDALDLEALERLVVRAAGHELRSIERLGLWLGLGVGLAQGLFLHLIGR